MGSIEVFLFAAICSIIQSPAWASLQDAARRLWAAPF